MHYTIWLFVLVFGVGSGYAAEAGDAASRSEGEVSASEVSQEGAQAAEGEETYEEEAYYYEEAPAAKVATIKVPADSFFDARPKTRQHLFSLFAGIPYGGLWYGYYTGWNFFIHVGGRYTLPLLHSGFLPHINDSLHLDFGADVDVFSYRYSGDSYSLLSIGVPVEVMWAFHVHKTFFWYVKAGLGISFNVASGTEYLPFYYAYYGAGARSNFHVSVYGVGASGFVWQFSKVVGLRAEVGYPWTRIGLTFAL